MESNQDDQETGNITGNAVCTYLMEGCTEDSQTLLNTCAQQYGKPQQIKFRACENCILHREKLLHHKGGQKLQWVAQRGCGISILCKNSKNLAGRDLVQGLIRPSS